MPTKKSTPKKRPANLPTAERMRQASRPSRSSRPTDERMRLATRPIKPKKASRHMTTQENKEQRGTGTGEEANRFRQQQHPGQGTQPGKEQDGEKDKDKDKDDKDKEADRGRKAGKVNESKYDDTEDPEAEGDPAKGKIDPDDPDRYIAMKDRRAYLKEQALKNQQANDTLNAIQVAQNEKYRKTQLENNPMIDPDKARDESMETAVAALKMHDPEEIKKQRAQGGQGRSFGSPTTPDFRAGQVSG